MAKKAVTRQSCYRRLTLIASLSLVLAALAGMSAADPYERPDESEVALSGTVGEAHGGTFTLDYGDGEIAVELVGWERDAQALGLKSGRQITVYGEIDTDFFTATTVEAEAVYQKSTNSFYYATRDEQSLMAYRKVHDWSEPSYYDISDMTLRGRVSSIDADEGSFTISVKNAGKITVETAALDYDPLDPGGLNPIQAGDSVRVSGRIDYAFLEGKVLRADTVTALH